MRLLAIIGIAFVTGCASSSGLGSTQSEKAISTGANSAGLRLVAGDGAHTEVIEATVDHVWRVLPTVFDSLGITVTDVDPEKHVIGNTALKVHKSLGGTSLTKYIDCGSAQGFPSADSYDVQMSIRVQVDTRGTTSNLSTLVEAVGRPMAFAGEYVRCSTKGELEKRIATAVRAQTH